MLNHEMIRHHEHQASLGAVGPTTAGALLLAPMGAGVLLGGFYGMRAFGKSSVVAGFAGGLLGAYAGLIAGIMVGGLLLGAFGSLDDAPALS